MFTGIVAAVGCIEQIEPLGDQPDAGVRLTIHAGDLDIADVRLGDSIAIQGACMTVLTLAAPRFVVEVSRESLNTTVGLAACGPVNLEKAMRLSDRLGGHMVSGHVDGLGTLLALDPVGESWRMQIRVPATLARYLAYKGSVTINGISLTVNQVVDQSDGSCAIVINVIAHTMTATTLKHVAVGDQVNLEIDLIARYVERMLSVANDA